MATQRYDKAVEQQRQTNKDMTETLMSLQKLKIDELDFEQIKKVLRSAMQSLADLKVQWANMSRFFSSIANIIKVNVDLTLQVSYPFISSVFLTCSFQVTLSTNLDSFKSVAEDQRNLMIQGVTFDDLMRDQMYTQAMQTNLMAHFVNHVATSYCQISEMHILPQVGVSGP